MISRRSLFRSTAAISVYVCVIGAVVLLPGLGSFGLWEPPDDWKVTHQRKLGDDSVTKRNKGLFDRPRSELRIAEEARRQVVPQPEARAPREAEAPKSKAKTKPKASEEELLPRRPPLTRALIAFGFRAFGVSEWAGRLPLAMAGVLCLLLTFLMMRRLFGLWTGILAAAVLLGLPGFVLQSRQLTSDILTIFCGLLAVAGLGLWAAPVTRSARWPWLVPGLAGLALGFLARGAVIGVLIPLLTVLAAVLIAHRAFRVPAVGGGDPEAAHPVIATLRANFLIQSIVLLVAVAALVAGAWLVLSAGPPRYSAFFGETPLVASKVLSYQGVQEPTYEWAVFDVLLKQLGYAAFPMIALLPIGLGVLFFRGAGAAGDTPALGDETARYEYFGRILLAAWVLVALLVGTYWVLRFGDLGYPALPAVAGVVAVFLRSLVRERDSGHRRLLALVVVLTALAILFRDLLTFPEALVSSHIDYRLHYPVEVSFKRFLWGAVVFPFGLLCLALLAARGAEGPVVWPRTLREWFTSSQLGLGQWLGLRLDEKVGDPASDKVNPWPPIILLALLAVVGGSAAWALQQRPVPGLVVFAAIATPVVFPLLPYVLSSLVDPLLFLVESAWLIVSGRLWTGEVLLRTRDEALSMQRLWQSYGRLHPAVILLLVPAALIVAALYIFRLFARAGVLLFVALVLLPVTAYSAVRHARGGDHWPSVDAVAVGTLAAVPILLSGYLAFSLVPQLSYHYSYKAIIDTYNHSYDKQNPQPLALFQVQSRSPVFYTKGPLVSGSELGALYPRRAGTSPILQYLEKGWTNAKGRHFDRVYAIVPVSQLGQLDRDAYSRDPSVPYYVLDARNKFYVLLSNRLGRVKRGGRLVKERDVNPLRRYIRNTAPGIHCGPDENARCVNLRVLLGERKEDREASLELIGAKLPKLVHRGRKFDVTLYFKVLKRIRGKYKVFLHIDGRGNRVLGDHDPVGGKYHTTLWSPGRWVVDRYTIPATSSSSVSTPLGVYTVYAGLFQGDRRMQVLTGRQDGKNRIVVGQVRVVSRIGCGCGP
ncbi:MAG: glycosyltransferase family 39 protein [bacterium]